MCRRSTTAVSPGASATLRRLPGRYVIQQVTLNGKAVEARQTESKRIPRERYPRTGFRAHRPGQPSAVHL